MDVKCISTGKDKLIILWDLSTFSALKLFQCNHSFDGGLAIIQSLPLSNKKLLGNEVKVPKGYQHIFITADADAKIRKWSIGPQKTKVAKKTDSLIIYLDSRNDKNITLVENSANTLSKSAQNIVLAQISEQSYCNLKLPTNEGQVDSDVSNYSSLLPRFITYNGPNNAIYLVDHQQNIYAIHADTMQNMGMFVGDLEEITDVKIIENVFMPPSGEQLDPQNDAPLPFVAIADNTPQPKIFSVPSFKSTALFGHTQNVLALETFVKRPNLLISASKDNTAKIWRLDFINTVTFNMCEYKCLETLIGHTDSVTALASSPNIDNEYILTASNDQTVKYWSLKFATSPLNNAKSSNKKIKPDETARSDVTLQSKTKLQSVSVKYTIKAHDKDINCVCLSPKNAKFFATGSMDKTAKLWSTSDGKLIGTFTGHKRGVWDCKFSTVHQILATASGDTTIKLWTLSDHSCVRTLEGSVCAVLHIQFVTGSLQLISSSSDGLLKLWTIENENCVSIDAHDGKIWSFDIDKQEKYLVSGGGSDGIINIWKDVSQEEKEKTNQIMQTQIQSRQNISNLMKQRIYDYRIFKLTIEVEEPITLLKALNGMLNQPASLEKLEKAIKRLEMGEIDTLLRFAARWNTNAKSCYAAQMILNTIFKTIHPDTLLAQLPNLSSSLQALIPYTDRHYDRLTKLYQDSTYIDYLGGITSLEPINPA